MIEPGDRQWWPFDVEVRLTRQSIEMSAKLMFLTSALRPGVRPFVQNSDLECGAIAENGRECLIAWRGKQQIGRASCRERVSVLV